MKILLLGFTKVKFMPYANFYIDNIDLNNNQVSILYWNRDLISEDLSMFSNVRFYEFRQFMEDSIPKRQKIKSFIKYRKFAIKIINKEKFDKIISLHTLPGLLVLDKLLLSYKHKYILDFRDVTFEYYKIYGCAVRILSSHSFVTFVSSDAYRKYLPQNSIPIITSHNLLKDSLNYRDFKKTKASRIRIAFWGLLRHTKLNKVIIDRLSNDDRFELHYYGREQATGKILREYVKEINAHNIYFHGEYLPIERYEFVKNTDIIHNIYHDTNTLLAMGNKYYDGIIFRIPQICMPNSQMAKMCYDYDIGCAIDPNNENFADLLYNYYYQLNKSKFYKACDAELSRVLSEYNYGCSVVKQICNT